jgi:hypothetical protein
MRGLVRITGAVALVAATLVLVAAAAGQPGTPPALAWSPSTHDYGTIDAGDTASQAFTLTNSGGSASGC